jgi:Tol biopolymer transport system component
MASTPSRIGLALAVALATLVAAAVPAHATFPGRNGAIAYIHSGSSGDPGPVLDTRGLYAAVSRAQDPLKLIDCELTDGVPSGGNCIGTSFAWPSYSADGRRIVFDTGAQLAVVGANGSNPTLLPGATADDSDPAFAPDGNRIVFTGTNDRGTTDVYIRRLDGGPTRVLVYDASAPAWSSRNRIAYVRAGNIYSVDPSGRQRRFVTSGVSPDWSPNGKRLVLVRPLPRLTVPIDLGHILVVDANGRGLRRIRAGDDLSHPVWSPDGKWIAFEGFESGVHKRRLVGRPRQSEVAPSQIGSEGAFIASYNPAWQPR